MAGDVNDPYRHFEAILGNPTYLRDAFERAEPEIKRRVEDALKHYTTGELGSKNEAAYWRSRAEQAEADLAEAGKVLWALRPVLRHLNNLGGYSRFTVVAAKFDLEAAAEKCAWLEEWLTGDEQ